MKVAITVPADDCPAVLVRVLPPKSSPGKTVLYRKYDPLFVYETRAQGRKEFLSPCEGTLLQWRIKAGQTIATHQSVVLELDEPCAHAIQFHGLCAQCGKDMTVVDDRGASELARAPIAMQHDMLGLKVSQQEARRLEEETSARLLRERKLSLIVDLDQTVIQATIDPKYAHYVDLYEDVRSMTLPDTTLPYYVKLRPGLIPFLNTLATLYELHIYTMGTRPYANAIAQLIDPNGAIFKERILSRDESGSVSQKTIQRLFPCNDAMVVAIDDRADVWQWSDNLIKVQPYDFFKGIGDINNPALLANTAAVAPKRAVTPQDAEKAAQNLPDQQPTYAFPPAKGVDTEGATKPLDTEKDDELGILLAKLTELHHHFYTAYDVYQKAEPRTAFPSVNRLLPEIKRKVIGGCHIVFSGVIPIAQAPQQAEVWRLAESFGAVCGTRLQAGVTTHLVAGRGITDKVMQARAIGPSIRLVTVDWLLQSIANWQRLNEDAFALPLPPEQPRKDKGKRAVSFDDVPKEIEGIEENVDAYKASFDDLLLNDIENEIDAELGSDTDSNPQLDETGPPFGQSDALGERREAPDATGPASVKRQRLSTEAEESDYDEEDLADIDAALSSEEEEEHHNVLI